MSDPPREVGQRHQVHQVSLRGASAKETSRDALLHRVSYERELRNHQRRQSSAALSIQKTWRGYHARRRVADRLQEEWDILIDPRDVLPTCTWISIHLLRPFLLFATPPARLKKMMNMKNTGRISYCFKILLQSINSAEGKKNFCSFALGTSEEKTMWHYQAKKLLYLSSFILAETDPAEKDNNKAQLATMAMRVIISLTDASEWKIVGDTNMNDAKAAASDLIKFMITRNCGLYKSVRRYICKLDTNSLTREVNSLAGGFLVVTASAITLALRPFNLGILPRDAELAASQYCSFILTIPYLVQRLPPFLLPALRHPSSLSPCLQVPLIISEMSNVEEESSHLEIPAVGWFLANMISLSTENLDGSGKFIPCLDRKTYACFTNHASEILLGQLENTGQIVKSDSDEDFGTQMISPQSSSRSCFMELLEPVHQQWYLRNLLSAAETSTSNQSEGILLDVLMFYYFMIRIYASLDPLIGPLSILNMLSFTPGFVLKLWEFLEDRVFDQSDCSFDVEETIRDKNPGMNIGERTIVSKDSGNKWANVLAKITRMSSDADCSRSRNGDIIPSHVFDDECEFWVVKPLKQGCQGASKEMQCMLYLFCSVYAHLLLVLDDIEFYDKQVPFTLSRQRKISSALNTFIYGSFIHNCDQYNKLLMDAAVRCLTLLYERDSRRQFCSPSLWVAPAWRNRLPIPAAARSHEALSSNPHLRDASGSQRTSSVISTIPHVFPFEDRE